MSKRSHAAFSEAESGGPSSLASKRSRADGEVTETADALAVLLDNANELVGCLKSLQHQREQGALGIQFLEPNTRKSLALLSKSVPSALQTLGAEIGQAPGDGAVAAGQPPATGSAAPVFPTTIAPPTSITAWTLSDISHETPPLPTVLDRTLEVAALTHSGVEAGQNYERLEWIGDAYLYLISSSLIHQTFKSLAPGKCAPLRERLVCNATLSGFSLRYNLHKRADFPAEFDLEGRRGGSKASKKERIKVLGDIFEAYVAAIILSDPEHGVERVSAWLKPLWASTLESQIRKEIGLSGSQAAGVSVKTQLARAISIPGVRLRYEDVENNRDRNRMDGDRAKGFSVAVYLDGWGETNKELGRATAISKKEAGEDAAENALANKQLMRVYMAKKQEYLAAQGR